MVNFVQVAPPPPPPACQSASPAPCCNQPDKSAIPQLALASARCNGSLVSGTAVYIQLAQQHLLRTVVLECDSLVSKKAPMQCDAARLAKSTHCRFGDDVVGVVGDGLHLPVLLDDLLDARDRQRLQAAAQISGIVLQQEVCN